MGSYLNQAKRRFKKLGWRSFTTAAIPMTSKLYGDLGGDVGADTLAEDPKVPGKFHNSGGEMIIAAAHLQASGHHQEPEAVGYRAVLIGFAGWTLHLITLYLDCGQDPSSREHHPSYQGTLDDCW